jgi:hypothetical protein
MHVRACVCMYVCMVALCMQDVVFIMEDGTRYELEWKEAVRSEFLRDLLSGEGTYYAEEAGSHIEIPVPNTFMFPTTFPLVRQA